MHCALSPMHALFDPQLGPLLLLLPSHVCIAATYWFPLSHPFCIGTGRDLACHPLPYIMDRARPLLLLLLSSIRHMSLYICTFSFCTATYLLLLYSHIPTVVDSGQTFTCYFCGFYTTTFSFSSLYFLHGRRTTWMIMCLVKPPVPGIDIIVFSTQLVLGGYLGYMGRDLPFLYPCTVLEGITDYPSLPPDLVIGPGLFHPSSVGAGTTTSLVYPCRHLCASGTEACPLHTTTGPHRHILPCHYCHALLMRLGGLLCATGLPQVLTWTTALLCQLGAKRKQTLGDGDYCATATGGRTTDRNRQPRPLRQRSGEEEEQEPRRRRAMPLLKEGRRRVRQGGGCVKTCHHCTHGQTDRRRLEGEEGGICIVLEA